MDLSTFDTSKVTDMQSMFEGCTSLESLDLSKFKTSKVQYMNKMFFNCNNLQSINFQNINSESLGTMYQMFYNCNSLKYLNIYSLIEQSQSIYQMFEGTSNDFKFCIKENENILKIFEQIKNMANIVRDCSNNCYRDGINVIEIPDKKLCCLKYEYNGNCVDKCPGRTIPNEEKKECVDFTCDYYYNYTQDGCIDSEKIPDGYFLNNSVLKTIDKCHEDCKTCNGKENENTTNCLICKDNTTNFYLGNCRKECESERYYDEEEKRYKCKCLNEKCFECSIESLELDSCISCNEGYYPKFNETSTNINFVNCYKEPDGYYFDNITQTYKQCYHSCKSCIDKGNKYNHLCTRFNSFNSYSIVNEENNQTFNCYPECLYLYYFDNESNYICHNEVECPNHSPLLVDGTNECVKSCASTKNKFEFRNRCYKSCPMDSITIENKYCKPFCPITRPFEMVKTQICVSSCYIMERFNSECITNHKIERKEELEVLSDLIMTDIRDDLTDTFDYNFIINNQSVIIEEGNTLYEIISTNISTKNKKISRIILGECENELKKFYSIDKNDSLYIFKIDSIVEGKVGSVVDYEIYYPFDGKHLELLDLSICEGFDIHIIVPINFTIEDLDKFNKDSPFYNDICYTYTNEGTDMTLEDRQKEFEEQNRSICEEDCELVNFNKKDSTVQCSCSVKFSIPFVSQITIDKNKLYEFIDFKSIMNFNVMKCKDLLFSKKGIKTNIGFYSFTPIVLMYFICFFVFYLNDFNVLKNKII